MRRSLTIWATLSLVAALLTSVVAGTTPTASAQAPTPYSGGGSASLLNVHSGLAVSGVADVVLSPVETGVNTETDPRSTAYASNLGGTDLLDAIDLNILSEVSQSAPADNATPTSDTTIPVDILPLLNLDVSTSTAHARWAGDALCLPVGESIAESHSETAGADVLALPGDITVASVVGDQGGVSGTSSRLFTTGSNTLRALNSETITQVDEVTLLAGTPLELRVIVADSPTLTATANGQPGGATVTYSEPVLTIEAGPDGVLAPLEDLGSALNDVLVTVLRDAVGDLLFGTVIQPLLDQLGDVVVVDYGVGVDTLVANEAPDGTSADATASLLRLHVSILPDFLSNPLLEQVMDLIEPLGLSNIDVDVDLGPMSANVAVPQGGITCPPDINPFQDLHKDAAVAEVAPGGQFDYTLTIPNHPQSPCNLTNVVVTDTITSPPGTVITSVPPADSVDGDTLTWNIGDLAINESVTITVTVQVPADAPDGFVFNDVLKASGDCDGTPVDHTVELPTPTVTDNFEGPCSLGDSNKAASHLEVLPGQTFSYFVHVFNSGAEPCSAVEVTDTLDDQVSFVSCTYDCSNSGQEVTWSGLTVPGGSGITLAVTVQVAADATGTLTNTAVLDSPDDPNGPTTVTVNGPEVTDRSVPAPPNPAIRDGGPAGDLPRTGMELPITLGAFALLALAFFGIRRRVSSLS